jgi:DNA-binding IclR family transcriptional regulator
LHATAVGQVLLAHSTPALQAAVLAERLPRLTAKTVVEPGQLRRVLAEVRRAGVAVCDGQVELQSLSVAAPIRGAGDAVVAAVSVVVPSSNGSTSVVPAVRAAARGISRGLAQPAAPRSRR